MIGAPMAPFSFGAEAGTDGRMTHKITVVDTPEDRQACYDIRTTVFVGEQNVPPELELDELEDTCVHFLARIDGVPMGTARLLDRGYAKIQRVAVHKPARGTGLGRDLMLGVLAYAAQHGFTESRLDAQVSAIRFYEKLGYVATGPEFDDAGIPHRLMIKTL